MEEFVVPIDLQADRLKAALEENVRLKERIESLERENRNLQDLDEINTRYANDWNRQASALTAKVETLMEVLKLAFAAR